MKKTSSLPGPPEALSSETNSERGILPTVKMADWIYKIASFNENFIAFIVPLVGSSRK
jgi:hypothetical protein